MLSEDTMVNNLREYRDLEILTQYLKEKEHDLKLWKNMLKRRRFEALGRDVTPQFIRAERVIVESKNTYDMLLKILNESDKNGFALATIKQQNSLQALTSSTLSLERILTLNSPTRNVDLYQQRWSRVNGLLLWQMNEMKPRMQWQLQRDLINTKHYISLTQQQLKETKLASQWSGSSWYGLESRVDSLLLRTTLLQKTSEENKLLIRNELISNTHNYLVAQQKRIKDYLAQSRLSIARLYDEALQRRLALGDVSLEEALP
jgi:hypothetical protein